MPHLWAMAVSYHDVTSDYHQAQVNELGPQGQRIVALSVQGDIHDPRYAAVWVPRQGPEWYAVHDVAEVLYDSTVKDFQARGFAPVLVTAAGPPGAAVFAAVFAGGQPPWFARHGLRWNDANDPDAIQSAMAQAFDQGYIPQSIAVYGRDFDPQFAGVWTRNTGRVWSWYWGNLDYHQRVFDAQRRGGQLPTQVSVGTDMRLSVYTDDHLGLWSAKHDMTSFDYGNAVDTATRQRQRPIVVQAAGLGNGARYAATFAADDIPFPKRWRAEGPAIPGAAELDAVFAGVMQRLAVRAATVAVAKGGTTYLTRAYTWAEDDWPTTKTTTTFRIASVSKAFTTAAIQALADDGVINNLNTPVFAYLGLMNPAVPHDPQMDTITIAQCATIVSGLPQNFKGNETFRDISIGLGRQATIRDLAAHIYTIPLAFSPGMGTGYSNSAFHVLGAVIEQASGMSYIDYVNRRLALPMGIQDLHAGWTAWDRRLPGEVIGYEHPDVGPNQLDLAPDAVEAKAYGGDILLDSAPGSGGLVTSAASMARFVGRHNVYGLGGRNGGTRYGTFVGTSAGATSDSTWDLAFATNREVTDTVKNELRDGIIAYLATHGTSLTPFDVDERFPIRGVLLVGGFRTQAQLNAMTYEDMRNTLIVELTKHSNQTNYQTYDNATLAGMGAAMVFFRRTGIRDDAALRTMSADDQRNTLIVEMGGTTGVGATLQALSTFDLALIALGSDAAVRGRVPGAVSSWIRGVLLLGGFRTHRELNEMSQEDMRNTLIVELTNHSNQTNFQAYSNGELEGMGAVMVLMRALGIRNDAALKTMSADDQRNTLIVALDAQTRLGSALQGLSNLDLVRTVLGSRPVVR